MRYVGFDDGKTPRPYSEIAFYAQQGDRATEVTEEEYNYMLEILPPMYVGGGFSCWMVREGMCDSPQGPVHSMYAKINGRYYAKWVVRGVPMTYIKPGLVYDAYPIDEDHARVAREQWESMCG